MRARQDLTPEGDQTHEADVKEAKEAAGERSPLLSSAQAAAAALLQEAARGYVEEEAAVHASPPLSPEQAETAALLQKAGHVHLATKARAAAAALLQEAARGFVQQEKMAAMAPVMAPLSPAQARAAAFLQSAARGFMELGEEAAANATPVNSSPAAEGTAHVEQTAHNSAEPNSAEPNSAERSRQSEVEAAVGARPAGGAYTACATAEAPAGIPFSEAGSQTEALDPVRLDERLYALCLSLSPSGDERERAASALLDQLMPHAGLRPGRSWVQQRQMAAQLAALDPRLTITPPTAEEV